MAKFSLQGVNTAKFTAYAGGNGDHYIATVIADAQGVEHVVIFNEYGVSYEERSGGTTTSIFARH